MKIIISALFCSVWLVGCAAPGAGLPELQNVQANIILSEVDIPQEHANMSRTETSKKNIVPPITEDNRVLPGTEIFTFDAREPDWYTVNDSVMGGVSNSTVEITDTGHLSFSGNMSLANNGGFSSVRSAWNPINLTDADGVLLRVMGDGQLYRLRIRSEATGNRIAYNASFETTPGNWELVYIPFASMVPTYFGTVVNVGELDTGNIGSFGFMLSDKQPGDFALQVDWIRAVSEAELPGLGWN